VARHISNNTTLFHTKPQTARDIRMKSSVSDANRSRFVQAEYYSGRVHSLSVCLSRLLMLLRLY